MGRGGGGGGGGGGGPGRGFVFKRCGPHTVCRLTPRSSARGVAAYSWTVENALDTHHGLPSLIRGLSGMVLPSVSVVGQARCCKIVYN